MAKHDEIYRKKKCELCGKYAFEKFLGTTQVLDDGFTIIEDYEKSGFGSIVIIFWEIEDVKNSRT